MSGKVILNYDNLNLDGRYPVAIIQPYKPGASHAKYFMADTVVMTYRKGMTKAQMERMAKDAAPLAERVVIDGMPAVQSHDIPYRHGDRAYLFA